MRYGIYQKYIVMTDMRDYYILQNGLWKKYPIYKGYSKSIYLLVIDETQVIKYNGEQNKCTKLKRR